MTRIPTQNYNKYGSFKTHYLRPHYQFADVEDWKLLKLFNINWFITFDAMGQNKENIDNDGNNTRSLARNILR